MKIIEKGKIDLEDRLEVYFSSASCYGSMLVCASRHKDGETVVDRCIIAEINKEGAVTLNTIGIQLLGLSAPQVNLE